MRLLVCGGYDFCDYGLLIQVLDAIHACDRIELVINGNAVGAGRLASWWADSYNIPILSFPAHWHKHGLRAGSIRNQQMLDDGMPDQVVAFPGGKEAEDIIKMAKARNIKVVKVKRRE